MDNFFVIFLPMSTECTKNRKEECHLEFLFGTLTEAIIWLDRFSAMRDFWKRLKLFPYWLYLYKWNTPNVSCEQSVKPLTKVVIIANRNTRRSSQFFCTLTNLSAERAHAFNEFLNGFRVRNWDGNCIQCLRRKKFNLQNIMETKERKREREQIKSRKSTKSA